MASKKTKKRLVSRKRPRADTIEEPTPEVSPSPEIITAPRKRHRPYTSDPPSKSNSHGNGGTSTRIFQPGHTIRFLPPRCRIMLDPPTLDFAGSAPDPLPTWDPPAPPVQKVGMLIDTAPRGADDTLYMRPTATAPYYEYVDAAGNIIVDGSFRFDPCCREEGDRLREAVLLMLRWAGEWQRRAMAFVGVMRRWREERRAWELAVVRRELGRGNLGIFCEGFGWEDVREAVGFVMGENERDRREEVDVVASTAGGSTGSGSGGGVSFAEVGAMMERLKLAQKTLEERIGELE